MQSVYVLALEPFEYEGRAIAAGDTAIVPPIVAAMLVYRHRARVVSSPTEEPTEDRPVPKPPRRHRRRYRRRDMTAEP